MRKVLLITIVVCFALTGCGKKDEKKSSGSADLIAPENASSYLLTLDDMPSGWSETPQEDSPNDGPDKVYCLEGNTTPDAQNNVSREFKADTFGPFMLQRVGVFATVDEAKQEIAAYDAAVDQCQTWTETNEDGKATTYTLSRLSFDPVGDESFAIRLGIGEAGSGDALYFRQGNVVVLVTYMELTIAGPQDSIFQELVEKAAGKLE